METFQPKSASSRFPPVHRADLEGQQRVDTVEKLGRPVAGSNI